ncbi:MULTISPECIES: IS5 family transposase [Novosphingobium]|uniref:Putative transposase n=1 Tax=Novosphingobium subterraneum TaxID=48936 RepID=A0A0B8Z604_9SPHN|nr:MULTISPECIES: IS5 family transposase [Novosphingobium]KHS41664.1 putative transposase [Novosphingobium subterraneum]QOV96281.1 IS5 family transposase [Novosphingobium sp. ES2-1]
MAGQPGFFDLSDRYEALSAAGDPLERLGSVVDFEVFRGPLIAALRRSVRGKGGRPPFDPVLMFKILVLQALYSLSDEATEFQIKDRLSFQRFLGLGLDGTVPDATTVWLFRERLVQAKAIDRLFARFDAALTDRGYLAMGGQIIDATVVPAPKQRNTDEEKAAIKDGRIPEAWKAKPARLRQKDRDARGSVKYTKAKVKEGADPKAFKPVDLAIPMFGYKNHIGIDHAHGLIRTWDASAANAHDGARLPDLVSKANTGSGVWADTAYRSKKNEAFLAAGMFKSHVHQKRKPRQPLPERIARANTRRSKVRAHVEHVFAGQKHRMGLVVRTIGIARATIKIGMANLVYNFQRLVWLEGRGTPA